MLLLQAAVMGIFPNAAHSRVQRFSPAAGLCCLAVQRSSELSVLLIAGGAVKGYCQHRLCMQVSDWKEVVLSGHGVSKRRVLHSIVACLVLRTL